MRPVVGIVSLAVLFAGFSRAADTPAAEFTKSKRLSTKLTLSLKDKPLKAALELIGDQLEATKMGRIHFEFAPTVISAAPAALSLDAKEQPLSLILQNLLGPHGLKATVISSETDKNDGWLKIVKGEVVAAREPPKGPPPTADEEKDAMLKFETAKTAATAGKKDDAVFLLKFILKKYPTSTVAAEAEALLETLKP